MSQGTARSCPLTVTCPSPKIRERVRAGITRAKADGKHCRRPPTSVRPWRSLEGPAFGLLPRFRTIQVRPKDFPAMPRQSEGAALATFVGGLTMSERFVDEGQSWASDIIGVISGVGLYSVLFFLVTFLCLYFPA